MDSSSSYDVAIIGGGIVGLATAMALTRRFKLSLIILEAEEKIAAHQTGHNSGVIHSGLYYKPGSLKAVNCVNGRKALYQFCDDHGIAYDRCGKVVVATDKREIPSLNMLEERGKANNLFGMRRLTPDEIKEHEPHVNGIDGLFVPQTGIVDYKEVSKAYARVVQEQGGQIQVNTRVTGFKSGTDGFTLETSQGPVHCKNIINCAGLQSDRIAKMCGVEPGLQIIPFRGEYYELIPERGIPGSQSCLSGPGCAIPVFGSSFY